MSSEVAILRYGRLRKIEAFEAQGDVVLAPKQEYLIRSRRGLEVGLALGVVPRDDAAQGGVVVREATSDDLAQASSLRALSEALDLPKVRKALAARAEVSAVGCERLFDGERTVVYYASTDRVDVPALRGELEDVLETRVLLEHVGARQRARLCSGGSGGSGGCGGCGVCGRALCCSSFLRRLEPVTLRMAKAQGLDLSPRNTAGACGRLKCCLRFENPHYELASQGLPAVGWEVRSPRATGIVLAVDRLRRKVLVERAQGSPRAVFAEEIEDMGQANKKRLPRAGEAPDPLDAQAQPGWSQLAKRLWRRVNPRKAELEEEG